LLDASVGFKDARSQPFANQAQQRPIIDAGAYSDPATKVVP
jgi:hypothetical protein